MMEIHGRNTEGIEIERQYFTQVNLEEMYLILEKNNIEKVNLHNHIGSNMQYVSSYEVLHGIYRIR